MFALLVHIFNELQQLQGSNQMTASFIPADPPIVSEFLMPLHQEQGWGIMSARGPLNEFW